MPCLAIQKAVKKKLFNVNVAVLVTFTVFLLIYMLLLLAETRWPLKTACRSLFCRYIYIF